MSNQDYLATAFVQIKPRTVGFNAELRKQIKAAIDPIKNSTVLVSPDTKGFSSKLRTQVRDAIKASGVHTVPVTPVLTKFRAQMIKQLNEKPIPITVVPSGKVSTGSDTAATNEKKLTDSQTARKEITDALRDSERLLKESTREGITIKERDALVTQAQAKAREALTRITEGQLASERTLVEAQIRARAVQQESATGRAAGGVSAEKKRLEDEAKAAAAAAEAEKTLGTVKSSLANVENKLLVSRNQLNAGIKASLAPTEELARISDELNQVQRISRDLQVQEVGAIRGKQKEQVALIQGTIQEARSTEELLKKRKSVLEQRISSNAIEKSQGEISRNIASALSVEVSSLTSLEAVREADNALKKEARALNKLEAEATGANAAATKAFVAEKQLEIQTRRGLLAEQNRNIKANLKETTSQKNLARGAGATFLSRLGARGATLAAGSEFLAGAAAVTLFAKAVDSAASLEQELNVFRITAQATAAEMATVSERAIELGADITLPGVSAGDAAVAFTSLAKAGLDVQDSLDGTRGVLQLATAAQIENAEATELVASALNAFGLSGVEATHVADLLTGAANEAQGSISDMGIALQQSSAVARQAGLNLEDTVAFITLLARAGIRGSDAGTSLRTALLRLIAPTEIAQKQLQALGITVLNAQGAVRPEVFAELQEALSQLNATARNQILRKIFGQDAIRAAVIFGREGTAGLNEVREATNQAGLAAELATARTQGFSGQIEALKNNLSTLGVTLGQVTLGPLTFFINQINKGVGFVNEISLGIKDLTRIVSGLKLPPISIDFEAGPVKIQAEEDGIEIGKALKKGLSIGLEGTERLLISRIPGATQATQATGIIRSLRQVKGNASETTEELEDLFATFRKSAGGPTALNQLALAMQSMIEGLKGGDKEAQRLAVRLQKILDNLIAVGSLPPIEIPLLLEEPKFPEIKAPVITFPERTIVDRAKGTFNKVGLESVEAIRSAFSPEAAQAMIFAFFDNMVGAVKQKTPELRTAVALGFDLKLAIAEATGASEAEVLAILRAREANQRAFFERQLARPQDAKQQKLTTKAANQLSETVAQIKSITAAQTAAVKQKADDIAKLQKEASDAVLKVFAATEQRILNKQIVAAQSTTLKDDIAVGKALLALYDKQKANALKMLKDKETLAAFLEATNQKIFQVGLKIAEDKKALAQSIRQQARENREKAVEGIELDIELAVINENRQREIQLRRKLINALEDQINHEKGNTLKIKQLRNEIARQKQAIKDAKDELTDRNNLFQQLSFQFLTAQQGFAANVFGNLIPGGVFGSTVAGRLAGGGGSGGASGTGPNISGTGSREQILGIDKRLKGVPGVGGSIESAAQSNAAGTIPGPTRGQATTEIELLRQILRAIQHLNEKTKHGESKKVQTAGGAANDTQ